MESIILRFRDTEKDIDTIKEHINIIQTFGSVWWGWWKKSNEKNNIEILSKLKNQLKQKNEIVIGLFDRTTERYFTAKLLNLEYNFDKKIGSPDQAHTPEYYNTADLNCWFLISEIEQISMDKFSNIFDQIPTKTDTFYEIPYQEETNQDAIIIDSNYILHLSDIHFGLDYGFPFKNAPNNQTLIDRLSNYLNHKKRIKIGLVIVTGDITSRGDSNHLFGNGKKFLNDLCKALNLKTDHIILVPGNHDIPLKDANFQDYTHEDAYLSFLESFYGRKKELNGIEKVITKEDVVIDILRMNSVRLRTKEEMNFGYVGWDDYQQLINKFIDKKSNSIKIALMHHHLISVPIEEPIEVNYEYGSVSVTLDAGKIVEGLAENGFHLVLHGHQHIPSINKVSRGVLNNNDVVFTPDLYMASAGSAGAKMERLSGHLRDNSFSILRLDDKEIEIEAYQFNPSKEPVSFFKTKIKIN